MPVIDNVEVWIEVEGVRTDEYPAEIDDEGTKMICWIPCEPGKEFSIGYKIYPLGGNPKTHRLHCKLDGRDAFLQKSLVDPGDLGATRYLTEERVQDRAYKMRFGELTMTDDDALLDMVNPAMGDIEVQVDSIDYFVEERRKNPRGGHLAGPAQDYRIHEQSKKGLTHCVQYGESRQLKGRSGPAAQWSRKPKGIKSVCTFIFRYRTLDKLIADNIAPARETTEEPMFLRGGTRASSTDSDIKVLMHLKRDPSDEQDENLDPQMQELRDLKAQVAALEATISQTSGAGASRKSRGPKREPRQYSFVPGEVIDLTID